MVSNDNDKRKLEEEVESTMVRKRLRLFDDDIGNDDSSNSSEQETEEEAKEEVSSEEMSMKQVDTSKEKLFAKRGRNMIFNDDGDTTLPSSEPRTPESRWHSDEDSSDEDDNDDFWM
jgi:hypothetical protein